MQKMKKRNKDALKMQEVEDLVKGTKEGTE